MDAFVFVRTETGRTRETADRAAGLAGSGIRQSVVLTGEWDVLVAVEADDPVALGSILMDQVLTDEAIAESQTAVAVAYAIPLPMPVRGVEEVTSLVLAKLDPSLGREHAGGWNAWLDGTFEALAATPGVVGGALITGEYDLLLEVGGDTWDTVSEGIVAVAALPGIAATSTAVAVTPKLVRPEGSG
jgi:DNA-binding Lrp family transcriptional regulator